MSVRYGAAKQVTKTAIYPASERSLLQSLPQLPIASLSLAGRLSTDQVELVKGNFAEGILPFER